MSLALKNKKTTEFEIAVVIIGRNEGERLKVCLRSIAGLNHFVIYVDSGSTDGSVAAAKEMGAQVVELDMSVPFTAARARNAGLKEVLKQLPDIEFIQFIDGDCELNRDWLRRALYFLRSHPKVAAVGGRVRERFPDRSIYNRLCDSGWNWKIGETNACGGIFMARARAISQVDGFRADLIAGEESELCIRLRRHGWLIWQLADDMVLHDAAMTRFGQWWTRTVRTGYAFALGCSIHGAAVERHYVKESRSAWLWGGVLPLLGMLGGLLVSGWMVVILLIIYVLQAARMYIRESGQSKQKAVRVFFTLLGKFAETVGQLKFLWHRLHGKSGQLIEYK